MPRKAQGLICYALYLDPLFGCWQSAGPSDFYSTAFPI